MIFTGRDLGENPVGFLVIKEHEVKFLELNGRPMPKDELKEHELYSKYKMTKAKLKLVDALLSKSVKQ